MNKDTNKHGLRKLQGTSRIARQLRQECGFGCVICGSAFYQYEHIDPEFKDAKKHDPAKMALLCGSCHDKVTKGIWSKQKVKEARANPHCLQSGFSSDFFDDGTDLPTFVLGGAKVYRPKFVLRILGEPLLTMKGAERSGGPVRITGVFYDRNGERIGALEDNCWKGPSKNWDIETVGQKITIRRGHGDIALVLRTEPRKALIIERLDMVYKGVRVYADERGVYLGPPDKELYGFQGQIVDPISCIDVSRDNGREISSAALKLMTTLKKFILYQPQQDDYLSEVHEGEEANILGWHPHPEYAIKFDTIDEAQRTAQRIVDNNGYRLLICELRESSDQFGVLEVDEVVPGIDPNLN